MKKQRLKKQRPSRRRQRRRLAVEFLEDRRVLAGNVTAVVMSGTLVITGDVDANDITIAADAITAGEATITPNGTTTLNGVAAADTFTGFTAIDIQMAGGNDAVDFNGAGGSITGALSYDGGNDDNVFTIDNYTIGGDATLDGENDGDQIDVTNVAITGMLTIDVDDAIVTTNDVNVTSSTVGGDLAITGTGGQDNFTVDDTGITGSLTMSVGSALDAPNTNSAHLLHSTVGGDATINGGLDTDFITVDDTDVTGSLLINASQADLGPGTNEVDVIRSTVGVNLTINGSVNSDDFTVSDTTVTGDLTIDTGDGTDQVFIENGAGGGGTTVGGNALITAGNGNDLLELNDSGDGLTITGSLTVDLGGGTDDVNILAALMTGSVDLTSDDILIDANVTSTIDQTYDGNVLFTGNRTLAGVNINFRNGTTVFNGTNTTLNASGVATSEVGNLLDFQDGQLILSGGTLFVSDGDAQFRFGDGNFEFHGNGTFTNNGTFNHLAAGGSDNLELFDSITFNNNGTFDFQQRGDIRLRGTTAFNNNGLLEKTVAGSDPSFIFGFGGDGGTFHNLAGGEVRGNAGTLNIATGNVGPANTSNPASLWTADGGDVQLSGLKSWEGIFNGMAMNVGLVTIEDNGNGSVADDFEVGAAGVTFNISGDGVEWSDDDIDTNGNTVTNLGLFSVVAGQPKELRGGGEFVTGMGGVTTLSSTVTSTGGSTMRVANGGTLNGTGTFTGGVTVDGGGTLAPGTSPGILNTGGVSLGAMSNFDVELDGTMVGTQYDQLNVTGGVNIDPAALLNLTLNFLPIGGTSFVIINNDAGDMVTGEFDGFADGSTFMLTDTSSMVDVEFSIDYQGGDGNDVVISTTGVYEFDGTAGDDTLTINAVDQDTANYTLEADGMLIDSGMIDGVSQLIFNGLDGDDRLVINNPGGMLFNPVDGIIFDGGTGGQGNTPVMGDNPTGDALEILGGAAVTVEHEFTNDHDGFVYYNGGGSASITYTGLEPVTDTITATDRTFTFTGGAETITLSDDGGLGNGMSRIDSSLGESVVFANPTGTLTINTEMGGGSGADTVNVEGLDSLFDANLTINAGGDDAVVFQTNATNLGTGSLDVSAQTITIGQDVSTSAGGAIMLDATRNIAMNSGSSLTTVDGAITLEANVLAAETGGFTAIALDDALITSTNGPISLMGVGGDTGAFNIGTQLINGAEILSTGVGAGAATITIGGQGGPGDNGNRGVVLNGAGSRVSSIDGDISIMGQGGDGSSKSNTGVLLLDGGVVESTGTGAEAATILLDGTAGNGTNGNRGVELSGADSRVTSTDGNIQIVGQGSSAGQFNFGVSLLEGGIVESIGSGSGAATITIDGTGGDATNDNRGVNISGDDSRVSSIDGAISITGTGGSGSADINDGVSIRNAGVVESTGTGADAATITINGTGGGGGGNQNRGVSIIGDGSRLSSVDGDIQADGIGGVGDSAGFFLADMAIIEATGTAHLDLSGAGAGADPGVSIDSTINSNTGDVSLTAEDDVFFGAAGLIQSASGTVAVTADNAGGANGDGITMDDGALIDGGSGPINLQSDGDVLLAGLLTTNNVTVTSDSGSILDNGDTDLDIDAATAILTALVDIGAPGAGFPGALDVDLMNLDAATSGTPNPGTHGIWVSDVDDITIDNATTADGVIVLTSGGTMSAVNVVAGGTDRGVSLKNTAGDLQVGFVSADGDRVHLDSAGLIVDGDGGPDNNDVVANELTMLAGGGIATFANPLETMVGFLAATAGVTPADGVFVFNTGGLTIADLPALPGPFPAVTGVTAGGDVVITAASPLTVAANVTAGLGIVLTASDSAGGGDDLTVNTLVHVEAQGGDVVLQGGDDVTLEDSSTVTASGMVIIDGDYSDADAGVGSTISLLGTIASGSQATVTGGADDDTIVVNPGVGHSIDSILLDGAGGDDTYLIQLGQLNGGAHAVDIDDSGAGDNDTAVVTATDADEEFNVNNNDANGVNPQTGGMVDNLTISETVTYTQTLENLTVDGAEGNDIFHVQPSQTAEITIDGADPVFGLGAGDVPQVPGDTLDFDPLDNTFVIVGKSILTNGGSPGAFLPVNFRSIENLPLMPLGSDTQQFDMDSVPVDTAPGYTSVPPLQLYGGGNTFGWDVTTATSATALADPLLKDFHYGTATPRTFRTDVPDGFYLVSVTMGNGLQAFDNLVVQAEGLTVLPDVDVPATQFVERSFVVQVSDGTLDLTFSDADAINPLWLVNSVELRPAVLLTLGVVDPGPLPADGTTVDVFQGVNATKNSLVTVMTDFGTIVSPDASSEYAGIQVMADDDGEYTFQVLRPQTAGEALIKVEETTGAQTGCLIVDYTTVETHFDFNAPGSPTAADYIGLGPVNAFDPLLGYGWQTTAATFDTAGPNALLRDVHYGTTDNTFQLNVDNGTYTVNVVIGNSVQALTSVDVLAEGAPQINDLATAAGQFVHRSFQVTVNDGTLDLQLVNDGGNYWMLAALDLLLTQAPITLSGGPVAPNNVADGTTIDTFNGSGAGTNSLVTVTTDLGVITTADADPNYAGVQVPTDGAGNFTFDVQRPNLGGVANLTAEEVNGASRGTTTATYASPPSLRFDLNSAGTPTAAGFIGVGTDNQYDAEVGYGWQTTAPTFSMAGPNALLEDFHYGMTSNTFLVDLPDGDYVVSVTLGSIMAFDQVDVLADGLPELSGLGAAAGEYLHRSFTTTVSGGQLNVEFVDAGGAGFFPVNAIEIFTAPAATITLSGGPVAPNNEADGTTIDAFSGSGASMNALVTVTTDAGVITTADADPNYAGVQVLADAAGNFNFSIQRPSTAATATVTAEEITAAGQGSLLVTYAASTAQKFDLNSVFTPTAAGYTGVGSANLFDAGLGYGWTTTASTSNLGGVDALNQDFHFGASDNTFRVAVTAGGTFDVTLRFFYIVGVSGFDVDAEGMPKLDEVSFPGVTASSETFTVTDDGDGLLDITFRPDGAPYFLVNAIEIVQTPPLLAAAPPAVGPAPAPLTEEALSPIVAEAIARWSSVDPSAATTLAGVDVQVADLSGSYLGLASPNVVRIDADGAGHGWFVDATPGKDDEFNFLGRALTADAVGRFDLLTAVMHELGHVLGYDDLAPTGAGDALMSESLPLGVRRTPGAPLSPAATDAVHTRAADEAAHVAGGDAASPQDESYWAFVQNGASRKHRQDHDDYFAQLGSE